MEKKEARIKCSGCGTSYKIRIPVTDKPVSFKCKKCGKVLKLKVKGPETPSAPSPPAPKEMDFRPPANFETTQLPDQDDYQNPGASTPSEPAEFVAQHEFERASAGPTPDDQERHWVVLAGDRIDGPFTKNEVVKMIQAGEVTAHSSLRMGERPWVRAGEIAEFKGCFAESLKGTGGAALETISLLDKEEGEESSGDVPASGLFYNQFPQIAAYPVSGGKPVPLALFAGIVFVASTALCLYLGVGFLLSIVLWLPLYGYLSDLMNQSKVNPQNPPPGWDFSRIKIMLTDGLNILMVFLIFTVVPVTLVLLGAAYFFLNNDSTLGYGLAFLGLISYIGSLFVVPAGLVIVDATRSIGSALSPGKVLGMITKGGKAYLMLAVLSILVGLICMAITFVSIWLVPDVIPVGFVVSGLLMAMVLSYAHFVWFHAMGRFSSENRKLLTAK
ncbi:MAG: DUF4013 domain-containing protein [Pseudomonadota bacterium]